MKMINTDLLFTAPQNIYSQKAFLLGFVYCLFTAENMVAYFCQHVPTELRKNYLYPFH